MLRLRVCGSRLELLCSPLGAKQYATQRNLFTRVYRSRNPCLICGHSLTVVRGTTSHWPIRATSSLTTTSATSYPPIADGSSYHRHAAPTATTTTTGAGRCLRLVHMQRAAHGVALPLRRNPLRTAARTALPTPRPRPSSRCGRTRNSAHQAPERPPGEVWVVASANVHVTAKVTR
jgi:hypothetical protein